MKEALKLKFSFKFETKNNTSFRVESLKGQYDLGEEPVIQEFNGDYDLPEKWNIGLIVGNSGSGKTSIAKHCFGDFTELKWDKESIINNFDKKLSMSQITQALGSVGFNSVPFWLKPFNVLSNGEKSRVELARMALEKEFVVYDEFTSLVDRDVAKSMSNSVQKLFRKLGTKLVAVTCHHDVLDWLQPDWVYDTDKKVFFCPKKGEKKNSNLKLENHQSNHGNIISIITI